MSPRTGFFWALVALQASAADYRLELSGQDVPDAGAWRTFDFAVPRLRPGDTLTVGAGEWSNRDGGLPLANCQAGAFSGDAGAPITLRGSGPRQSVLVSDGSRHGLQLFNCAWWSVDNFLIRVSDGQSAVSSDGVSVTNGSDVTLSHLTVVGNNRNQNSACISVIGSPRSQVTECEVYDFSLTGIRLWTSPGGAARRNYVNSRHRTDGAYAANYPTRGDTAFSTQGVDLMLENNISENTALGFSAYAYELTRNISFIGNISIDDYYGVITSKDPLQPPPEVQVRDHLAVRPFFVGAYFRSSANTRCDRCSLLDTVSSGFAADRTAGDNSAAALSTTITRGLAVGRDAGTGITVRDQATFVVSSVHVTNYPVLAAPGGAGFTDLRSGEAGLGACRVYAPVGSAAWSPVVGTLGATVLEVSNDGTLTGEPLWNPSSGQWRFCGPMIPGVHDLDGGSCLDVHTRLNVVAGGCPLPPGYGADAGTNGGSDAGLDAGSGDGGSDGGSRTDGGPSRAGPYAVGCACSEPAIDGSRWWWVLAVVALLGSRPSRARLGTATPSL